MPIVLDGPVAPSPSPSAPSSFSIDLLLPHILPSVKSAARGLVYQKILWAADDLLRRVRIWQTQLAPVTPVVNQTDYPLVLPVASVPYKLIGWAMGGVRQRALTLEEATDRGLEPSYIGYDPASTDVFPVAYMLYENVVRVLPAPSDVTQSLVFTVGLTIDSGIPVPDSTTQLPGVLRPYLPLLADGALSKILELPEKDYTNQGLANAKTTEFNDGVSALAIRVARAFGSATIRRNPRTY